MKILGIMSGTSMDGVDLALCNINESNGKYEYQIIAAETIPYDERWRLRLSKLNRQDASIFWKTHVFYGKYIGRLVNDFLKKNNETADLISSHGHTVFHLPSEGYTAQIGDGAAIYAETGIPTVCDFRSVDIALGGQGAPLVPIGDQFLFGEYQYCLNLGGIANISGQYHDKMLAFDVCPCNIALNRLARNIGKLFDENGDLARSGALNEELLDALNAVEYYKTFGPKSMSREWINTDFWHITKEQTMTNEDKARTLSEHIAIQISKALYHYVDGEEEKLETQKMLVTGGGAFNTFLIEAIKAETSVQVIVPDEKTIQFKEALIFGLLGYLRVHNKPTSLASVTGAKADSIGGAIYGPIKF
ncbi:MAG: anhydro-N-acetylmuramic acid kinase [Bacteroidetes bacterium]|nr:anhydro-N-acetylmuramic acid kinase [Bacteroidota bacterium]